MLFLRSDGAFVLLERGDLVRAFRNQVANLILAATRADGYFDSAYQGGRADRTFEHGYSASRSGKGIQQARHAGSAAMRKDDERQFGPGRLGLQLIEELGKVREFKCFFGEKQCSCTFRYAHTQLG